ncbi:MAG: pitrilysin family protein [Planctomycetales bacterium]
MPDETVQSYRLPNGLTLLVERMPDVQSAAFSLVVPAGSIHDPSGRSGCAAVAGEMMIRGAGGWDSRELLSALDNLGVQHNEGADRVFISFNGALLGENLGEALSIYSRIVQQPTFPKEQFPAVVAGARLVLDSIEDEPRQKVILELRRRCYETPWGLPAEGSYEGLEALSLKDVIAHHQKYVQPEGAILGIAGQVDPEQIRDLVEREFGGWKPVKSPALVTGPRGLFQDHIPHESTQTQIGIAYNSIPYSHPDYYAAWGAVNILSGGSSSRLFTEVREKRGLCYSVYATLHSLKDQARVLCYAGTTNERAQETLDVMLQEIRRLDQGILKEELDRCKARAKSALIMQQESSSSRASSLTSDWYHLGRVLSLEEVRTRIESLTEQQIVQHLHDYPVSDLTVLTLGPAPLEIHA